MNNNNNTSFHHNLIVKVSRDKKNVLDLDLLDLQDLVFIINLILKVSSDKKNVQDLDLLFSYVQKLVDAAAETSFLIGADYASVQASERLHSALNVVQQVGDSVD